MNDAIREQLARRVVELEAERDAAVERAQALAAHVARWKEWLGRDPEDDAGDWMDEGWAIAKESPTISLAHLKAEWQADAVSEFASRYLGGHEQELAEIYAGKLRRQAEGGA